MPIGDTRSQQVRAGVEDETYPAVAPSWHEAWAGDSEASLSPHGGHHVAKVATEREQRITRVAASSGGHRKFDNLMATKRVLARAR